MKRTFLAKRNSFFSSANLSWGIAALVFALIVLGVRVLAPNFFWKIFTPVFQISDALDARSHSFLNNFSNAAALALKNEQLANENASLADENQILSKKLADISALSPSTSTGINNSKAVSTGILAGVVARPPESPYDTLVLAAGLNEGVTGGMEAFGAGGVPIGIVSSVLNDFSRVTLFSAPGIDTSGWVGHTNLPITLFGTGAGTLIANVARSANITVGDVVFMPGPGMLPIGAVTRIDGDPSSPSVTLRIQPALNIFSISWVLLRDTGSGLFASATSTLL